MDDQPVVRSSSVSHSSRQSCSSWTKRMSSESYMSFERLGERADLLMRHSKASIKSEKSFNSDLGRLLESEIDRLSARFSIVSILSGGQDTRHSKDSASMF